MTRPARRFRRCDGCGCEVAPAPLEVGVPGGRPAHLCVRCAARLLPAAVALLSPGAAREWLRSLKPNG